MARASTAAVVLVVSFYVLVSVSTTLMNKSAFPREVFPFPFTVTCFQMAVALLWLAVLSVFQRVGPASVLHPLGLSGKPLSWDPLAMRPALFVALAFTGMLATGNLCLMFVQVSFYQAAKSQHILFSLLLSASLGRTVGLDIAAACAGVAVGFVINATAEVDIVRSLLDDDLSSLAMGVGAGLVSSFFVALYPLLLKRSMQTALDNWQISINVNMMSFVWFLPLIGYEVLQGGMLENKKLYDPNFWAFNFATASVGFVLNIASMLQVRLTSPLTHMVVGAFKGAVTTCLGVVIFGNRMSLTSAAGVSILILSSFAYSYLKYQHSQSEQQDDDKDK